MADQQDSPVDGVEASSFGESVTSEPKSLDSLTVQDVADAAESDPQPLDSIIAGMEVDVLYDRKWWRARVVKIGRSGGVYLRVYDDGDDDDSRIRIEPEDVGRAVRVRPITVRPKATVEEVNEQQESVKRLSQPVTPQRVDSPVDVSAIDAFESLDKPVPGSAEAVRLQKISVERLSGIVTPSPMETGSPKADDENTISFVGGFLGCSETTLRGIPSEDRDDAGTQEPGGPSIRRLRELAKQLRRTAPKSSKPKATAQEVAQQKRSVGRLSTPNPAACPVPPAPSSNSLKTGDYSLDGEAPKYWWKHVEGARYCLNLFEQGPPNEPGLWKTTHSRAHPSVHIYTGDGFHSKRIARPKATQATRPKPATPAQVRQQRRSVNRLSGAASSSRGTSAAHKEHPPLRAFTEREISGLMGFKQEAASAEDLGADADDASGDQQLLGLWGGFKRAKGEVRVKKGRAASRALEAEAASFLLMKH